MIDLIVSLAQRGVTVSFGPYNVPGLREERIISVKVSKGPFYTEIFPEPRLWSPEGLEKYLMDRISKKADLVEEAFSRKLGDMTPANKEILVLGIRDWQESEVER